MLNRLVPMLALTAATTAAVEVEAWAQDAPPPPIVPDRPSFTTSAQIVPARHVQLEMGYTWTHTSRTETHTVGEIDLRLPVFGPLELDLLAGGWQRTVGEEAPSSGFADSALGCKLRVHDSHGKSGLAGHLDVALLTGTFLPTGNRAVAEHALQPWLSVAVDAAIDRRFSSTVNLGVAAARDAGRRFTQAFGGAALAMDLGHGFSSYVEGFAWWAGAGGPRAEAAIDTGLSLSVGRRTVLDIRGGIDFAGTGRSAITGAGITMRF